MTSTGWQGARFRAGMVALAAAVMAVALVSHPFIEQLPDATAIGAAVEANTAMWAAVHLLTVVGIALTMLAFLAVRAHLREAGEDRYSPWALPLVLFGSALYGFLPGLEFAPLAAARAGLDAEAVQAANTPFFVPVLAVSAVIFAIGAVGFAMGIAASRIMSPTLTRTVGAALVVLAASRMVPLGAVQFYVQALAVLVALWPLAYHMWRPETAHSTHRHPATA